MPIRYPLPNIPIDRMACDVAGEPFANYLDAIDRLRCQSELA